MTTDDKHLLSAETIINEVLGELEDIKSAESVGDAAFIAGRVHGKLEKARANINWVRSIK